MKLIKTLLILLLRKLEHGLKYIRVVWIEKDPNKMRFPIEEQMLQLKQMVISDHRWMAHVPEIDALTTRYLAMLDDEWFKIVHQDSSKFRQENNLEPDYNNRHR